MQLKEVRYELGKKVEGLRVQEGLRASLQELGSEALYL